MSRSVPIPYFPIPPLDYNPQYLAEVTRAFANYAQQMNTPGPWRATSLTLTPTGDATATGVLTYNSAEDTLDLSHLNGVVQQLGVEQYMRATNDTGSAIPNGTVVGFTGVNGEIKVAPYLADGSVPELHFVGVATFDMADGDTGMVTTYGKVRGLDTTGPGAETWSIGDILYASPTTAGGLTNVRPTAPDVVIVVAAVLSVDATAGVILVRPTIPMGLDYGSFDSTSNQTLAATNTATAITLANTMSSNGITLSNSSRLNVAQAGFYNVSASLQLTSGSSSSKMVYFWLRKNGANEDDTTRAITVNTNNGESPIALNYTISLEASDYIELYWAADSTAVSLSAITGLSFAPDAPSVLVNVSQLQL